jgi:hypothetical protein
VNNRRLTDLPVRWFGAEAESTAGRGVLDFQKWAANVALLDGSLSWLKPMDKHVGAEMEPHFADAEKRDQLSARFEKTVEEAKAAGFAVPEVFLQFMRFRELRHRIPSCTACYFDAPDRLVKMADGGVLFRFLNDQQWCVLWYLYLGPDTKEGIVASSYAFDVDEAGFNGDESAEDADVWVCAFDFESFLFRFWVENNIWFAKNDGYRELTELERHYELQFGDG